VKRKKSKEEIMVARLWAEIFSVVVQVMEAEDISLDSVVILSFEGLSLVSVVICLDF
jgi:hypothetical protein